MCPLFSLTVCQTAEVCLKELGGDMHTYHTRVTVRNQSHVLCAVAHRGDCIVSHLWHATFQLLFFR